MGIYHAVRNMSDIRNVYIVDFILTVSDILVIVDGRIMLHVNTILQAEVHVGVLQAVRILQDV